MTPNTDAPDADSPNASDGDATSPESLILDYYLNSTIDPKSMLTIKKLK